jgi:hypothetical protein
MSTLDHTLKPEATSVRRLEVITGTGRRRQFSEDFKTGIVEETLVPGAVVSDVARRHGLTPQCSPGAGKRANRSQARLRRRSSYRPLWIRRFRRGPHVSGRASGHARWLGALAASRLRSKVSACGSAAARKPRL